MRIGVFGGTFDPPHNGHLMLARTCLQALNLDEVIFLPANRNPLKDATTSTSPKDRLEMVRLAIAEEPKMAVSDIEITRGGRSYTVDTMTELHMVQPAEYWFLMGSDTLKLLPKWKDPKKLLRLCRLGVVTRAPASDLDPSLRVPPDLRDVIDVVPMEPVLTSSTDIRNLLAQGLKVDRFVPAPVIAFIRERKLYEKPE